MVLGGRGEEGGGKGEGGGGGGGDGPWRSFKLAKTTWQCND